MMARLQHQPASSRATATAATVGRLPRASKLCQRRCRRRSAASARTRTAAGCPSRRRASSRLRARGRPAMVPGGLDQQASGVAVAGLGDRPLAAALPGGVLAGHKPQVGADRASVEALPVADLPRPGRRRSGWRRRAGSKGGRRPPPRARLAASSRSPHRGRRGGPARPDGGEALLVGRLQAALREALPGEPALVGLRPGGAFPEKAVAQEQLGESVAGTHQIGAGVLTGAYQVTGAPPRLGSARAPPSSSPRRSSLARRRASRRSVLTRSPGARAIFEGRLPGSGSRPPHRRAPARSQ